MKFLFLCRLVSNFRRIDAPDFLENIGAYGMALNMMTLVSLTFNRLKEKKVLKEEETRLMIDLFLVLSNCPSCQFLKYNIGNGAFADSGFIGNPGSGYLVSQHSLSTDMRKIDYSMPFVSYCVFKKMLHWGPFLAKSIIHGNSSNNGQLVQYKQKVFERFLC